MVNPCFEETLSSDNDNQLLVKLVQEAQKYPMHSSQRQLALNKLVNAILKSPRLGSPQKGLWSPQIYKDLYHEALQKSLLVICQRIDKYNPKHEVMAWVNFLLSKHFIDVINDHRKQGITYLPKLENRNKIYILSLDDLDQDVPERERASEIQLLQQFIEEDPENLFKKESMRERPDITFQWIAKARFFQDKSWEEIADEKEVSAQTLCSFFYRRLQKLMPYFKKHLSE